MSVNARDDLKQRRERDVKLAAPAPWTKSKKVKGPIPGYLFDFLYLCSIDMKKTDNFYEYVIYSFYDRDSIEYLDACDVMPASNFHSFLSGMTAENFLDFDWIIQDA